MRQAQRSARRNQRATGHITASVNEFLKYDFLDISDGDCPEDKFWATKISVIDQPEIAMGKKPHFCYHSCTVTANTERLTAYLLTLCVQLFWTSSASR
jgi:hypothetical protein